MDEEGKKQVLDDFNNGDGSQRLDLWDYALGQQVIWEEILAEMQLIAREQGIDKKLDKMMQEELEKSES